MSRRKKWSSLKMSGGAGGRTSRRRLAFCQRSRRDDRLNAGRDPRSNRLDTDAPDSIHPFCHTNTNYCFTVKIFLDTNFREQRIDGAGLPLLTEDHLTGMLQMKLGPALKLRAVLARRLESCAQCQANTLLTAPVTPNTPKINGTLKPEPRSNTTSPS
ncbi:unnamed protein product [Pieris macdunnoughi]|uniref:SAM domain-containing protein n=1 Tax=Pieris macdunnoughi TaxID=345717 RepID=A0A821WUB1_9NEOP|nr:unnamed protein product [Pieris macdunnoughi]